MMVDAQTFQWFVTIVLGVGGATFIWTVTRSYLAVKARTDSREDRAMERMENAEARALQDLADEREWGAFWFRRAALLESVLLLNHIEVPPLPPTPPVHPGPDEVTA